MKKKIILLSIQIVVVFIALSLTVGTYAWYMSQSSVTVTPTTVYSATTSYAKILKEEDLFAEDYKGETGNGYDFDEATADDVPYTIQKIYTIALTPLGENYYLSAEILSVTIDGMGLPEKLDSSSDPTIIDNFTFRLEITKVNDEEVPPKTYAPDEDGFMYTTSEEDPNSKEYYPITGDMTLEMTFTLIYQSEENYLSWEANRETAEDSGELDPETGKTTYDYEKTGEFEYSAYDFMHAKFTFNFELGIARKEAE